MSEELLPKKNFSEISIEDLFRQIWNKKILISLITSLAALISVLYSLYTPNIYTSTAIIAPSSSENSLTSNLGGYSSLAGFAGINIRQQNLTKHDEAIERIKSFDFFVDEFIPNIKYQDLVAYKNWNSASNKIIYDANIFKDNKWVRKVVPGRLAKPSNQEAFKIYKKILNINEDAQSSFITIKINHVSPFIAKEWIELIILKINNYMRDIDKEVAQNSINFLKASSQETNITQIKIVISKLIESHIQTLTLAESNIHYVFKPVSSPIAPEEKSGPLRALICIFGTLFGFLISIFYVFFTNTIIRQR
tara:strand:+ start:91 stop:1011 length:921 start_codon:yes stop_codon:yes gene_type:complete